MEQTTFQTKFSSFIVVPCSNKCEVRCDDFLLFQTIYRMTSLVLKLFLVKNRIYLPLVDEAIYTLSAILNQVIFEQQQNLETLSIICTCIFVCLQYDLPCLLAPCTTNDLCMYYFSQQLVYSIMIIV
jgi:hypothetical protein